MKSGERPGRGKRWIRRTAVALAIYLAVCFAVPECIFARRTSAAASEAFWRDKPVRLLEIPGGAGKLRGYLAETAAPRALVVMAHGMNAEASQGWPLAERLLAAGFSVLLYDAAAAGGSDGITGHSLHQYRLDAAAVLVWVAREGPAGLPVALCGFSAGGWGLATAMEDSPVPVLGLVTASAPDRPEALMMQSMLRTVPVISAVGVPGMMLRDRILYGDEADRAASQVIAQTGVPALIIHSRGDTMVPPDLSIARAVDAPNAKTLWLPEATAHSDLAGAANAEQILAFLEELLAGGSFFMLILFFDQNAK